MSLEFECITLNIGGMEITGTVLVSFRETDASFGHAFGTERLTEVEYGPEGFVPDKELGFPLPAALVSRAVSSWMDANEGAIEKEFEKRRGEI